MLLSQAHLHHELTGELLEPCIGRIVDLLTNPRPENLIQEKVKKGKNQKKVTKNVHPTLPTSQQADGTSAPGQSTLLGTMVCSSVIVNPALWRNSRNMPITKNDYIKFPLLFNRILNHIQTILTLLTKNHL
jgi:hypothetical protein